MSDQKCFCHINDKEGNTYIVKDKEARESLAQLTEEVDAIHDDMDTITADVTVLGEEVDALKNAGGGGGGSAIYMHNVKISKEYNVGNSSASFTTEAVLYSSSAEPMTWADIKDCGPAFRFNPFGYWVYDSISGARCNASVAYFTESGMKICTTDESVTDNHYDSYNFSELTLEDIVTEV